ncbi:MAG: family 10 glycosylhydrolase [Paenibacillus macerans]|uniref:family 10 glycosylhydrolase n=1 Tax=Paenibacillus macerans TaxID=44252 RepID=UPI0024305B20|nr:family 10 glycosylhydrolase [Paenibacillus macerans]MBS5909347.1 family 10 glycosylhydrolase [Paenibacillus macerans]
MKFRTWFIPLLVFLLAWPIGGQMKANAADAITILLDGTKLTTDAPPYIKAQQNVTMVPLRVISEGLGAQVAWSQAAKTVTIQKDGSILALVVGEQTAQVNGAPVGLDVSVESSQGRTMVPLRFVGEQLGLDVDWDQQSKTISLSTGRKAETPAADTDKDTGKDDSQSSLPQTSQTPQKPQTPQAGTPVDADGLRGVWVSTVANLDWPSTSSYGKAEAQKAEYIKLLDDVQAMGMNAAFVQVRPSADAIYPSKLVPWSSYLTGTAGKDPGYDPLQFLIEETHRRGMEFHAWFNPFRASTGGNAGKLPANHVANAHPDWIVKFDGKLYINPGIPEAREHVIEAIMEVVQNYDIDGVHLDDYFYPTGETASSKFNDDSTYKQYNAKQISNKGDWRRDNINQFVEELGASIKQEKPKVSFGISPFGVWRNKTNDITGSDTKAGITAYDSTYADVRTWIKRGWIDYVAPQLYWSMTRKEVQYDVLANWWAGEVRGTGVKLYIGHAPYKIGTPEIGWSSASEIISQLEYNRQVPEISGSIFFSAKDLRKNPLGLIPLLKDYYGM